MNTLKLNGLHIDTQDLGAPTYVIQVSPYYAYADGVRTERIDGYKYGTVFPAHGFERLDIKVPGPKAFDIPAGQYVAVMFDHLEVKLYFDHNNHAQLTAKADKVHVVSSDKPHA